MRAFSPEWHLMAAQSNDCLITGALPLTNGLPPSHLGIVCKHPLLSVWRRFSEYKRAHAICCHSARESSECHYASLKNNKNYGIT